MMTLLLEQNGTDVMIIKKVIKITTRNKNSEKKIMPLLLEQREADMMITEEVIKTTAIYKQNEILRIIEKFFKISPFKKKDQLFSFITQQSLKKQI